VLRQQIFDQVIGSGYEGFIHQSGAFIVEHPESRFETGLYDQDGVVCFQHFATGDGIIELIEHGIGCFHVGLCFKIRYKGPVLTDDGE